MIASPQPSRLIRCSEQCISFLPAEEVYQRSCFTLRLDRQHALDLRAPLRRLKRHVVKKRADRCETKIPSPSPNLSVLLQFIQEGANGGGIDIIDGQV